MVWLRFTESKECILRIQWRSWNWKQVHLPASHLSWKASANKKRVCKERDWNFVDSNERDQRMQENHVRLWLLHNAEYQIEKKNVFAHKKLSSQLISAWQHWMQILWLSADSDAEWDAPLLWADVLRYLKNTWEQSIKNQHD